VNRGGTATAGKVRRWLSGGLSLTVGASTLGFDDVDVEQQGNGDEGAATDPIRWGDGSWDHLRGRGLFGMIDGAE
jgi:hypothetical protein